VKILNRGGFFVDALEMTLLFDHYGELLTERQRMCFELYYDQDLTLAEIASEYDISRQGVYDIIRRCRKQLQGYESRLHLIARFVAARELIRKIHVCASDMPAHVDDVAYLSQACDTINRLSQQVLEEL
jgi:predicted DNA-binding protein YlxM (UPF0122 family)